MKTLKNKTQPKQPNITVQRICTALVLITALLPAVASANHQSAPGPRPSAISAQIEAQLASLPTSANNAALRKAYAARGNYPAWVGGERQTERLLALGARLSQASEDGLDPAQFRAPSMPSAHATAASLAQIELHATATLLRFEQDLRGTSAAALKLHSGPLAKPVATDAELLLARAAVATDMAEHLSKLGPQNHFYTGLKKSLVNYRALRTAGGWQGLTSRARLKPGMRHAGVRALRERLYASGDLLDVAFDSDWYDDTLSEAVKRFQTRNGLDADGDIGPLTQRALRQSTDDRINQLLVNMERARWLGDSLGERFVVVNVPGFELEVREGERIALEMDVIVGRKRRSTPSYSSAVTRLEFNPYWGVPDSIARKDILPKLQNDPGYLAGLRIYHKGQGYPYVELGRYSVDWETLASDEPFPYYFRQDPGPANALGQVKFLFDNPYNVYLHDTPSQELFARASRAFSSGCIRMERPIAMAQYLLSTQAGWDEGRIQDALDAGKNLRLELNQPIKVHLVYQTAWLDKDGVVQFRADIYSRDRKLARFVAESRFNPALDLGAQAALEKNPGT